MTEQESTVTIPSQSLYEVQKALIDSSTPLLKTNRIHTFGEARTYVGMKVIHAVPMTRGAYNRLRGWSLPVDEDGEDDGYLVEYADGGKCNVPGFQGYVSWSPQQVFENSYKEFIEIEMTFFDRLLQERAELEDKATKLALFLVSEKFKKLPDLQQKLLKEQKTLMVKYLAVLDQRIKLLS